MSLLEDIFLGDEANEAQELERVIEGDEYEDHRRSRSRSPDSNSNSEKEDEAEEDKRRVDPTKEKPKRVIKNPRQVLNYARLTGPRGISIIPDHFKDFKFKGKGCEKDDLDLVLKKLEHWAFRLYPKFKFEDCLKKIETLGKKQAVNVHLRKIRSDQLSTDEPVVQKESSDDEGPAQEEDEFDKLLQQQIELARATPAPGSVKKGFMTPGNKNFAPPKATSSPSISDEQKERMLRNRRLAEERRLARLQQSNNNSFEDNTTTKIANLAESSSPARTEESVADVDLTVEEIRAGGATGNIDLTEVDSEVIAVKRHGRPNVIDSSDEENDVMAVNEAVSVDVHCNVGCNNKVHSIATDKEEGDSVGVESTSIDVQFTDQGSKLNSDIMKLNTEGSLSVEDMPVDTDAHIKNDSELNNKTTNEDIVTDNEIFKDNNGCESIPSNISNELITDNIMEVDFSAGF